MPVWRWRPWSTARRASASIPATSAARRNWPGWWLRPRCTGCRSGWGSIPVPSRKTCSREYGYPTPERPDALIESALRNVRLLEALGFYDIKISIKSSDTLTTIAGYRQLSRTTDYPLHLGVTEAGGLIAGTVKSSVALGILLSEGIGDTFRISLTRDPVEEIRVGFELLRSLRIRERGPELISCPTCGRTRIDLFPLAETVEQHLQTMQSPLKVAVMGCVVNGPGEAREADIGIAGGHGVGIIFKKGEIYQEGGGRGTAGGLS